MTRVTAPQVAFNSGELGKLWAARIDTDQYGRGCKTLVNFIPTAQGPATKRHGTRYVTEVKNSANSTRLIPFIFSEIDSVVLEFGDQYIRFYSNKAQVQSGGSAYEISTPYAAADVFKLKYAQLGDIMYLSHPDYKTRKLTRLGVTNWTLTELDNLAGPVLDSDPNEDVTMSVAGGSSLTVGSSVTITASASTFGTGDLGFQASHVGSLWRFSDASGLSPYDQWTDGTVYAANTYIRNDGKVYFSSAGGTAGEIAPVHTSGTVSDGGVDWLYVNTGGDGYARMTARNSATEAVFTVTVHLPPTLESGSPQFEASSQWGEAAWSDVQGWPRAVAFHEERLFFAGTNESPLTIWGSRSNRRFEDFNPGLVDATDAITYTISARNNTIQWLISDGDYLLAGTYGGIAFLGTGDSAEPLSPTNVKGRAGSNFGCSDIAPIQVYNTTQYIDRSGSKLLQAEYDELSLKYKSLNLTVLNSGVLNGGVTQMAVQEQPYDIAWMIREDGQLVGLTQEENQEVRGWHRHVTGLRQDATFDVFESIAVIPGALRDIVWVIVKRVVGAQEVRYVEYMELFDLEDTNNIEYYVDSGIEYSGASTTTISGLTHIDNEDVKVLGDGAVQNPGAVSGGSVTLSTAVKFAYVGLPFNADLEPMLVEAGGRNGPAIGKPKNVNELWIRLYKTVGLKYGRSFTNLNILPFRETDMQMDNRPVTFGDTYPDDKRAQFDDNWTNGNIAIRSEDPLPCTIVALIPRMTTNDT